MNLPDGPMLMGIAAIISSIATLVTTLRSAANRPTMCKLAAPSRSPRRRTRGAVARAGTAGRQGG